MGVIHKLKPELIEFILEQKKIDKNLSCRKIAALVYAQFKLRLSKSSANSILKQAGLSMPAGRRSKPGMKAAPQLKKLPPELKPAPAKLKKIPSAEEPVAPIRCIKINLSDGGSFYLDGRMYTLWRSSQIPEAFSAPISEIKNYIEDISKKGLPWVLFFARGYDSPTEELFKFISSFTSPQMKISQLILYDKELRELEKINAFAGDGSRKEPSPFSRHFVFGVWPWQFKEYIKVRLTTEFLPFKGGLVGEGSQKEPAPAIGRNFYIAEAEVELVSPKKEGQPVKLRGVVLKTGQKWAALAQNRPFTILSNFTGQDIPLNELANLYLNRWPDLEAALQDFSRKIIGGGSRRELPPF